MRDYYSNQLQELTDHADPFSDPALRHILRAQTEAERYAKELAEIEDLYRPSHYDTAERNLAAVDALSAHSMASAVQRDLLAKEAIAALSAEALTQHDLHWLGSTVPTVVDQLVEMSSIDSADSFKKACLSSTDAVASLGAAYENIVAEQVVKRSRFNSALDSLSGIGATWESAIENYNARLEKIKKSLGESESRFYDSLNKLREHYGSSYWSSVIDQINTSLSKRKKKYVVALFDVERSIERQKNCGWLAFVRIDLRLRVLELSISCLSNLQSSVLLASREVGCFLINQYKGKPSQDGKSDESVRVVEVSPSLNFYSFYSSRFLCPKRKKFHWPTPVTS